MVAVTLSYKIVRSLKRTGLYATLFERMHSSVYPTRLALLRPFIACLTAIAMCGAGLTACGGGGGKKPVSVMTGPADGGTSSKPHRDAAVIDSDAALPIEVDSGIPIPGSPPPELMGQACAVDTNKLYKLATQNRTAVPAQLAVDVEGSRFALAYTGDSSQCTDALYVAELEGAPDVGMPKTALALDPCSTIVHGSIGYNGTTWLLGSVDARKDSRDLWLQPYDGKNKYTAQRITNNVPVEREVALLATGSDSMLAAWVEQPVTGGATTLKLRPVDASGKPTAAEVTLTQPDGDWTESQLSMTAFSDVLFGLAYRRIDAKGNSQIVLDVVDAKGVRDRDTWVLSPQASASGSVDLASDGMGAGVIYSVIQGTSEQLWFQLLGLDGRAANVMSGAKVGGPQDAERIVEPPEQAVDASLAKLPTGYAVAYRALPGGDVDKPRIRIHFLDRFGRIIGKSDAALAAMHGGRTAIKAAYDGRVTVGYSDTDDSGATTIIALKLPCLGGGP
jgi:hypothetical protein